MSHDHRHRRDTDAARLLREYADATRPSGPRVPRIIAGLIGWVVGGSVAFVILLVLFAVVLGGDGQAGVAAMLIGVPLGGWLGAMISSRFV